MVYTSYCLFITVLTLYKPIFCFNFENRDPLVKKAPDDQQGSYFGFSVAQHSTEKLNNQLNNEYWILVGAPLGKNLQPGTNQSGALFKCPISNNDDDCTQIETDGKRIEYFDYEDEEVHQTDLLSPSKDEIKNGQWLGVTVRSQKPGGIVLVCAHRYIKSDNLEKFHYGQGLCYLLDKDLNTYDNLLLCKGRAMEKLHQQFGFCQVGTSASFVGDDFALMGAPGPYTWRGTLFGQTVVGEYLYRDKTIYHAPFGDIDIIEKYSYLGMSVGGGHFFSKNEYTYIAGAPRSKMVGQVYFFKKQENNEELNISLILTGEQFASSFGYELLAVDVNNDGYDDLLVGTPFYYSSDKKGGAVYIYYNIWKCTQDNCPYDQVLYGKSQSRFGFSMTSLGDINKDGYNDVAIGAPYEDEHGAVYIYLGSPSGLNSEPSQLIKEEQINTLGYSLSGGLDMDSNGYPDLLVGAFESDRVLLYKARPIIDIKIEVFSNELVNINASRKGCDKLPNNNNTCFSFKTCFSVVGSINKNAKFNVRYNIAEEKKFVNRIWIIDDEHPDKRSSVRNRTIPVNGYSKEYCLEETVNIKESISDILSPLKFKVDYSLENNSYHTPILNKTSVKMITATFQKECGSDDICESNMTLSVGTDLAVDETGAYKVNMINEDFILEVNVTNSGESAYEAKLFVIHPKALSYVILNDRNVSDGIKCWFYNDTSVSCDIGNPLQKDASINLKLRFEVSKDIKDHTLRLYTFVNSTSTELSKHTSQTLVAVLEKIAKFQIRGKASSNLFYGGKVVGESAVQYLDDIGARVIHKYLIDNNGQWDISDLKVLIKWPLQVSSGPDYPDRPGKWLLYLENNPKLSGVDGFCVPLGNTRPNELQLNMSDLVQDEPESLILNSDFDESFDQNTTVHSRKKRSTNYVVPYQVMERGGKKRKIVVMDCFSGSARCIDISCTIRKLNKGNQAEIDIQSRIWNSTLVEDYSNLDWVVIRSTASIDIDDKTFNISSESISEFSAETIAYPAIVSADTELNWLIIGGAAFVGLLLLFLLIFVLYKCGFFKRKRVSKDPTLSGNLQKKGEADQLLVTEQL